MSKIVRHRVLKALEEDVGQGDWTTEWCVPERLEARGVIVAREAGVVAGLAPAAEVFRRLGGSKLRPRVSDGDAVESGASLADVEGAARTILTGERVALNFLMRLSGIATLTRRFVDAVQGTGARITDTRKTTPLWRELERAATRAGGAVNHRAGLYDMILIKDNHVACAGGVGRAIERIVRANGRGLKVEVEVTDLVEVDAALEVGVDRILLDNMSVLQVHEAVSRIRARSPAVEIEASGGVTLETVRSLAEAGVDYISVGALTHSAPALDLALDLLNPD